MRKIIILMLIIGLLGGGYVFWQLKSATKPVKQQVNLWYCPMHPQYTSDHQGKCPICHMNLVKRKDEVLIPESSRKSSGALPDHVAVNLDKRQQGMIGVATMKVERKEFVKRVNSVGYVLTYLEFYMEQNKFIDAYVDYVQVFRDYRRVKDRRRTWEIHRELQTKLLEAKDKLLALGLSHQHIERLQEVSRVNIWQEPQLQMFDKNTNYWVVAESYESDLGFVDVGQEVQVHIPAFFENISGVVRSVGGVVDPDRRTVKALIEIPQYRGHLVANMQADVVMDVELNKSLLLPRDAVVDLGYRQLVYVKNQQGSFEPVEVELAWRDQQWVSIKSGIKEGDYVVVNGHFLLDSESRLQAVLQQESSKVEEGAGHVH
jgi:hypothetical protein